MNEIAPNTSPDRQVAALDAAARRIDTPCGDGTMAWRVWGSGPALLLLHGGHGSWTHWIRNVRTLAEGHTVIAADMPGYGDSTMPPPPHTAEHLGQILVDGLDRVVAPPERIAIAGFSFGGVIGGHVTRLLPERVERLVISGSGGLGLPRAQLKPLTSWRYLETQAERDRAHRDNLATLMIADPARIDALAVHLQAQNAQRAGQVDSPSISRTDTLRRALAETRAPLAGIWGEHDATSKGFIELRRDLLRSIDPQAEFEIIPDAGHWAQFEAPEQFNAALMGILGHRRPLRA